MLFVVVGGRWLSVWVALASDGLGGDGWWAGVWLGTGVIRDWLWWWRRRWQHRLVEVWACWTLPGCWGDAMRLLVVGLSGGGVQQGDR